MSIKIMSQVWDLDLPSADKFVLIALADSASDEGMCWPLVATIARKCGKSEATIYRAVDRLEKAGHLSRENRKNRSNMWEIHPKNGRQQDT